MLQSGCKKGIVTHSMVFSACMTGVGAVPHRVVQGAAGDPRGVVQGGPGLPAPVLQQVLHFPDPCFLIL